MPKQLIGQVPTYWTLTHHRIAEGLNARIRPRLSHTGVLKRDLERYWHGVRAELATMPLHHEDAEALYRATADLRWHPNTFDLLWMTVLYRTDNRRLAHWLRSRTPLQTVAICDGLERAQLLVGTPVERMAGAGFYLKAGRIRRR